MWGKTISTGVLATALFIAPMTVSADDGPDFTLTPECTTKATGLDGVRHNCTSEWSTVTAPENHVINRDSVKATWLSDNGSENRHDIKYDDWVTVIADLTFPQTMSVRVYALGPKGHGGGRGWSRVRITGTFTKYK